MLSRFALTLKLCWHYIVALSVLAAVFYLIFPTLAVVPVVLIVFVLFFFRNPKRNVPDDKNCILSPADGVIMEIDEVIEDRFIQGPAIRISIFLSILNVHLNRSPLQGEVRYRYYRPGKFIPAFKSHASDINEKNFIGIESGDFKVLVCQITGFIARRIKCWADEGKRLAVGELIGIIKFGSGTEIFIPTGSDLYVKKGDKVKAGESALGMLPPGLDDNK
ncbi:phosphatidylserine decarboxylase [Pelotomaculum schinkii]|uniref:Phosphatidylserine decarboxylase proenzyme n=2 Tax=Pelotomaculum schinkii TaxID=78350 RepID=A0A4Y7RB06_9FIRM|nr:phosphatidylserine decarboxylase family protein [Pelotomaculum schinkii]TEB06154.1 phosphatidylserine decarboxylase [Pelotomaculum schinkii]